MNRKTEKYKLYNKLLHEAGAEAAKNGLTEEILENLLKPDETSLQSSSEYLISSCEKDFELRLKQIRKIAANNGLTEEILSQLLKEDEK